MFNSLRLLRHILTVMSLMPTPDSASVNRAELGRQFMLSRARTVWHNEKVSVAFLNAEDVAVPQVAVPLEYNDATQSPLSPLSSHNVCLRPTGVTVELDPATQSPLPSLLTENRCFHPPDPDPESSSTADVHEDDIPCYNEFDSHSLYFYGSPASESMHIHTAISTSRAQFHDTSSTAVDSIASQSITPPAYYTSSLHSILNFSSVYLLVLLGNLLAFFAAFGFLASANALVTAIVSVELLNVVVMIVNAVPTWQLILGIAWIIGRWSYTDTANVRHRIRCGFADLADLETACTLSRVLIRTGLRYKQLVHYLPVDDILTFKADVVRSALPSLRLPKRGAFRAHNPLSSKEAACMLFSIEGAPVTERSVVPHPLHSSRCSSLVPAPSQNSVVLFCLILLASSSLEPSSALSLASSDSTLPLALTVEDPTLISSSSSTSDLSLSLSNTPQDSMTSFDSEDSELLPSTPEFKPSGRDDEPEVVNFVEDNPTESDSGQTTEATPRGMFDILQKGHEGRLNRGVQPDGPDPARDRSVSFLRRMTEEAVLTYLKLKCYYNAGIALILGNAKDATDNSEPKPASEDGPPPIMVVEEESTVVVNSSDAARRKKKRKSKCQRRKNRQVRPEGGGSA